MRVLAVDDDALVLMSTAMMLEEMGHEVVEATSGDDALRELEAGRVDVVVTDFMMPGMTGYELMQKIRARTPDLPVLIVSGFVNLPHDVQRNVPLLPKPFGEAQLAAAIRQVVQQKGLGFDEPRRRA